MGTVGGHATLAPLPIAARLVAQAEQIMRDFCYLRSGRRANPKATKAVRVFIHFFFFKTVGRAASSSEDGDEEKKDEKKEMNRQKENMTFYFV